METPKLLQANIQSLTDDFYKYKAYMYQTLFNSLINEKTSEMVSVVQRTF